MSEPLEGLAKNIKESEDALTCNNAAGCVKANISSGTQAVAQELMREEIAHITALNNQLRSIGESPSCPLINLGTSRSCLLFHEEGKPLLGLLKHLKS